MPRIDTFVPKGKHAFAIETPEGVPPLHTLCIMAGKRGAGKTTACVSMLRFYRRHKCADRIFWISPTCGSNKAYLQELGVKDDDCYDSPDNAAMDAVVAAIEAENKEWEEYLKALKAWKRLRKADNVEQLTVQELIDADSMGLLEGEGKPKAKYGHKPVLHVVLDDSMGSRLFVPGPKSRLTNVAIKHRHIGNGLGASLWLLVQSYSSHGSLPRSIRENATVVCLYWTTQEAQRAKMAEELSDRRGEEVFLEAYRQAAEDDEHAFLMIDYSLKGEGRYRQNWDGAFLPAFDAQLSQQPSPDQKQEQHPEQDPDQDPSQPRRQRVSPLRVVARY